LQSASMFWAIISYSIVRCLSVLVGSIPTFMIPGER
jgi:hypothetical protein